MQRTIDDLKRQLDLANNPKKGAKHHWTFQGAKKALEDQMVSDEDEQKRDWKSDRSIGSAFDGLELH